LWRRCSSQCVAPHGLAVKIKTVGSLVVVAGPLHGDATEADYAAAAAAADIVRFASPPTPCARRARPPGAGLPRRRVHRASCAGGHKDRIADDIFGDTVNPASCCMATAAHGAMHVSQSAVDAYGGDAMPLPEGELVQIHEGQRRSHGPAAVMTSCCNGQFGNEHYRFTYQLPAAHAQASCAAQTWFNASKVSRGAL
jgi:class 3 adenylate cyclase